MSDVQIFNDLLTPQGHEDVYKFLSQKHGWSYGGSSGGRDRHFYKHFAGDVAGGLTSYQTAAKLSDQYEQELERTAPIIWQFWKDLKSALFVDHKLFRVYANGMPPGIEGAVHRDSDVDSHITAIYYPHLTWSADHAGETLFFDDAISDVCAVVHPKPNRLAVFSSKMPHVARPASRFCSDMRITLMFKTLGVGD